MFKLTRLRARLRASMPATACVAVIAGALAPGAVLFSASVSDAKTPGSTYCFYGKCHRVKTISETQRLVGKTVSFHTSHYDSCHRDRYNPCGLTSSGEPFFADRPDNAASPIYPDGTKLLVWSPHSKEAAVIRINNAGPYWGNRKLDVSRSLASKLGFARRGVAKLETRILSAPTRSEARYKRNRRYAKVQGPIGKFESLDEAEKGLAVLLAFEAMTTAALAPSGGSAVAGVARPFEVAAKVTQGRAFAAVRPDLKKWPVVARQFAQVRWPVVGTGSTVAEKTPVAPEAVRVALAWPVVKDGPAATSRRRAGTSAKLARLAAPSRGAVKRKTRSRRVASAKSKRRVKTRNKRAAGPKTRVRRTAKVKSGGNAQRRRIALPVAKNVKPKGRPYVAVRQILHRSLGRTGV